MKFIGEFIKNIVARFRNDVYLENISSGTIASGGNLGLDSNNKIVKANETGDIEGVTAGDGLTGGGTTGAVTLAVGAGTGIDVAADAVSVDVSDFMTNGSDNRILTATGTDAMNAEANLIFDGSNLSLTGDLKVIGDTATFESANADDPHIIITNTYNGTNNGARLDLRKLRADNAVEQGLNCGEIWFSGQDNAQNHQDYAYIIGEIDVGTNGQESGQIVMGVANNDGGTGTGFTMTGGSAGTGADADDKIDVTLGLGTGSLTTIAGDLTVTSDATISGGNLTVTSGTSGDARIIISADTDNNDENDSPQLWFKADGDIIEGAIQHKNNTFDIISNVASNGGIRFLTGTATNTGTTDPETGATERMSISSAGVVTLAGGLTFDSVALTAVQTSAESFADNDTSLMTSAAINDRIIAVAPATIPVATIDSAGKASFPEADFSVSEEGAVTPKFKGYFLFQGYGTSDGSNYEMAEIMTDANSPFEHNTSRGTNGLTAGEPREFMKAGAKVMPRAGVLTKWTGWSTSAGSGTVDIGLFKVTPTRNNTTNLTPVLLKNHQYTALGNTKLEDFDETSFSAGFSAGDMIYMAVKGGTSDKTFYVDSTLEVQFS